MSRIKFQWSHFFSEMDSGERMRLVARVCWRFNGATSFQKWIGSCIGYGICRPVPFQWSHFFSEMDSSMRRTVAI